MIRILLIVLCTVFTMNGVCQELDPQFEVTFYIEDALGETDSVEMGFDPQGGYNLVYDDTILDPRFGEQLVVEPFDSIFECRAFHLDDYIENRDSVQMSKRIIGSCECNGGGCLVSSAGGIAINALNLPVTITYDPAPFLADPCLKDAVFITSELAYTYPEWHMPKPLYCLSDGQPIVLDFDYYYDAPDEGWFEYEIPVEGQGRKKIPLLMFEVFLAGSGPCPLSVSTDEQHEQSPVVYPNPAGDEIYISELPHSGAWTGDIYNVAGEVVASHNFYSDSMLDISELLPGLYFLRLNDREGSAIVRFVKH